MELKVFFFLIERKKKLLKKKKKTVLKNKWSIDIWEKTKQQENLFTPENTHMFTIKC